MTSRVLGISVASLILAIAGATTAQADFNLAIGIGGHRPVVYGPAYYPVRYAPSVVYYDDCRPVYSTYYARPYCGPRVVYRSPIVRYHRPIYTSRRVIYRY